MLLIGLILAPIIIVVVIIVVVSEGKNKTPPQNWQQPAPGPYPGQAQGYYPGQGFDPAQAQGYYPGQGQGFDPAQAQGYYPGQGQGFDPAQAQGFYPGQAQGFDPAQVQGGYPGPGQGVDPVQAQGGYPGSQPQQPQAPVQPQPEPVAPAVLCLQGVGGEFDEKKFRLEGDLFLGRQPARCQICYTPTAAGISGLHCQVRRVNNALELTDLGSSFGTFVKGEQLAPNTPVLLQPGDSFWLADPVNTFIVVE